MRCTLPAIIANNNSKSSDSDQYISSRERKNMLVPSIEHKHPAIIKLFVWNDFISIDNTNIIWNYLYCYESKMKIEWKSCSEIENMNHICESNFQTKKLQWKNRKNWMKWKCLISKFSGNVYFSTFCLCYCFCAQRMLFARTILLIIFSSCRSTNIYL